MAQRKLGIKVAEKLKHRLADLSAAASVDEIIAGRPRKLDNDRIALELCDGIQLVFCAGHHATATSRTGTVNWGKVERIKVLSIGI
ncbi:killer suppression protein HigA [Corallococcus exiguus]|uniref:killer suppression protein HigA n=1 Tax=Corallococcus exiguus TaxID=83462 RepID=UPI001494A7DA|nr:killer suppression protein HigA [Corallococcus exiguus]NPD29123.1 killer suppression protein HigA [Corallococcus exiguus]